MKKKLITFSLLIVVLLSSPLFAHEFWLMPSTFRAKINEPVALTFYVGESFMGEIWGKRQERTSKLTDYIGKTVRNLTTLAIKPDSSDMQVAFDKEGTHLLTMESKNSFIGLEADKFNDYLKEDGLDNIYQLRQSKGELNKPSKEFYRRCAKTLIQVGSKTGQTFKKNTGMPLEIIPLQNPYTLKNGSKLTIQVLFKDKPVIDGKLVTWFKNADTKTIKTDYRTDKNGKVTFDLDKKGYWMVSLVHMIALENNTEADYQSYWGNLTFEF